MKSIPLFIAIVFLCLSCGNRRTKNNNAVNDLAVADSVKIENEGAGKDGDSIICERLKEFQDITPLEVPADGSTYKAFFYYKNGKKDLSALKDKDVVVQWSNQLDTTLTPIDGFFKIEISTEIVLSDFLASGISLEHVDVDRGQFVNGLKDGEWIGAMCGGMNSIERFHIFYTKGVIDSLHYFDCPFHHKEPTPDGATYTGKYFYFKSNLPHGRCFEIINNIDKLSYDTVVVKYNDGKLVDLPKVKDKESDGLTEDPEEVFETHYIYRKYRTVNGKKEGEWVTSGSYRRTEQGDLRSYNYKNIVISNYRNDLLHGEYIVANFFREILPPPDNAPKTIFYKTEFRNGTGYYVDGDLMSEGPLLNGKKNGTWKYYKRHNGSKELCETGDYINDKKHGLWKLLTYPNKYENGEIKISYYSLYYNGRLLYKGIDNPISKDENLK